MKPHTHPQSPTLAASTDWPRRLPILLAIAPILFLVPLFPFSTVMAQGHGSHGGGSYHNFPAESVAPIPSPAALWTKIHRSHVGLLRAVPAMSKSDVEFYLKALNKDLNTYTEHPGGLDSQARVSLEASTQRVKDLSKTLKNAVKSTDAVSATTQLAQLNEELGKIERFFPAGVPSKADGLSLAPLSSRSSMEGPDLSPPLALAVKEVGLTPVQPRPLFATSRTAAEKSTKASDMSDEDCPMSSKGTGGDCSCCAEKSDKTRE